MSKAIGINKIEYGTVGDGVPALSFTELAETIVEGSVLLGNNEPADQNMMSETSDTPYHTITTKDSPDYIDFKIYAPSAANLLVLMGGSVSSDEWSEPITIPEINKTWKFTTNTIDGQYIEHLIVNGKTSARFADAPGKKASETVSVRVYKQAAITAAGVTNTPYKRTIVTA